jgi:hypothetical protein
MRGTFGGPRGTAGVPRPTSPWSALARARVEGSPTPPQPDETHRIGGAHAVAIIDAWSSADRAGLSPIGSGSAANDMARAPDQDFVPISADRGERAGYGLDSLLPRPPGDNG